MIIYGLYIESDDMDDLKSRLESFFVNVLYVVATVTNVTKVNNLMFIVQVDSVDTKSEILEHRNRLNKFQVYVKDDMSTIESGILDKIDAIAQYQSSLGKDVWVGYMRVFINGKKWRWDDERNGLVIEESVNPKINRVLTT